MIAAHVQRLAEFLRGSGVAEVVPTEPVHSPAEAQATVAALRGAAVDAVIVCQPVFGFPHNAVSIIRDLGLPTLLYAPWEPTYPAVVGVLTIGGGLSQIGLPHARVWGDLGDPETQKRLLAFIRGAGAVTSLRGGVIGQLGGRSMGLYTTAADGALWQAQFGVDLDHADQIEIARRGDAVPEERARAGVEWLSANLGVPYDGQHLTEAKLLCQVRHYLGTKDLVRDLGWDAVALKCHYEMSEFQVAQCLTASLLNDPLDWEGGKAIVPTSCEADADGALTMLALHRISGAPASLLDVRFYDRARALYVLSNCGAAPISFASRGDWKEALGRVSLCPCTSKYLGGGAQLSMVFAGDYVTVARLTRGPDGYRMLIGLAKTVELPPEQVEGAAPIWPHAFLRWDVEPQDLIEALEANHVHLVQGDYREELRQFCRFAGVDTVEVG